MENKIHCPDCCKEVKQNELLIGIGGCVYCPMNEGMTRELTEEEKNEKMKKTEEKKIIEVKKVGENPGFCREYYKGIKTKRFYAKVIHPNNKDNFEWFTTSENYGEPDCSVRENIKFVEVLE